jgi:hypothetical protein
MAQTAAHLVDHVIPRVPVRQWVLSLPIPLRLLLAAQPKLVTVVEPDGSCANALPSVARARQAHAGQPLATVIASDPFVRSQPQRRDHGPAKHHLTANKTGTAKCVAPAMMRLHTEIHHA